MRVDDYLLAISQAMNNAGEIVPWPLHLAQIGPYFSDIEAADLYQRLRGRIAGGAADRDIGELFVSASSGMSLLMDIIPGLKDASISVAERLWFVDKIFDGLAAVETGDIFCADGGHRLMTGTEVSDALDASGWNGRGARWQSDLPRAAFGLSGAAQALIWAQHFYGWTDIGFVIHGPYQARLPDGGDGQLVVRDFFDLRPVPVWPQSADIPVHRVVVSSLHDGTDHFAIDIFNHLLHARGLEASCVGVRVEVDGIPVTQAGEIGDLTKAVVDRVRRQHAIVTALSPVEVLTKFIESRYYALRRWRAGADQDDWRPPAEVVSRIRDIPLAPPPPDNSWEMLRSLFDPRID
jgi:hypothetical protein